KITAYNILIDIKVVHLNTPTCPIITDAHFSLVSNILFSKTLSRTSQSWQEETPQNGVGEYYAPSLAKLDAFTVSKRQ
ncbi:hypothetical protein, partial [Enterovibrio norvegicus]|uniref:hypothetical protein n=1 Tax=Enterovibrio norvegicus TaxID=188144 RepID=UPI001A7E1238